MESARAHLSPARTASRVVLFLLLPGCATPPPIRTVPEGSFRLFSHAFLDYGDVERRAPNFDPQSGLPETVNQLASYITPDVAPRLTHDPALDLLAAIEARREAIEEDRPFSEPLVRWLLWRVGAAGGSWRTSAYWFKSVTDARWYRARGHDRVAGVLRQTQYPSTWGAAEVVDGVRHGIAVLRLRRSVRLESLPKRLDPDESFQIRGRLLEFFAATRLMLDTGAAQPLDLPIQTGNGTFSVPLRAPRQPGRYLIEVVAYDRSDRHGADAPGRSVLLRAALYVGVGEPDEPDPAITQPRPDPPELSDWPAQLIAHYNEARAAVKSPPLRLSTAASQLAAEHLSIAPTERARARPDDGRLRELLVARGVTAGGVLSLAHDVDTLEEVAWLDLHDLGRRAWLLDPEVVDVGVAFSARSNPRRVLVYLARRASPTTPAPSPALTPAPSPSPSPSDSPGPAR